METRTILAYIILAAMVLGIGALIALVRHRRNQKRRGRRSWW